MSGRIFKAPAALARWSHFAGQPACALATERERSFEIVECLLSEFEGEVENMIGERYDIISQQMNTKVSRILVG